MGTNYYLHEKAPCPTCGHGDDPLHIGKSSGGWCFALHVIPEQGINTLDDWVARWSVEGVSIQNEYEEAVTPAEMLKIITERNGRCDWSVSLGRYYGSWQEFHIRNQSEEGPNGLLRHRVDGRHCIGQGEGTYDYITGEFS